MICVAEQELLLTGAVNLTDSVQVVVAHATVNLLKQICFSLFNIFVQVFPKYQNYCKFSFKFSYFIISSFCFGKLVKIFGKCFSPTELPINKQYWIKYHVYSILLKMATFSIFLLPA